MSDWWYVIAIVGLAAVGVVYLRARRTGTGRGSNDGPDSARARPDFTQDREASRLSGMSAEDRAWEAASLRTNRATRERDAESPGGGAEA